jgi:hypothetical protein
VKLGGQKLAQARKATVEAIEVNAARHAACWLRDMGINQDGEGMGRTSCAASQG